MTLWIKSDDPATPDDFVFTSASIFTVRPSTDASSRMAEDLGMDDCDVAEFVDQMEFHLEVSIAKPVTVNTLGELAAQFWKSRQRKAGAQ